MKSIHLVLQGKGGVGKSLVSSLLCQYFGQNNTVIAIDTDPVNNTLSGYKNINPIRIEIIKNNNIDQRQFDRLADIILNESGENHKIVIDNGAASFLPLCAWMFENKTVEMWRESGCSVFLHTIVTGGQAMFDTLDGLEALIKNFDSPLVIWLNNYFGEISAQDKQFEDFSIYKKSRDRVRALIRIPQKNAQTFGRDLEELFARRQTFSEAADDSTLPVMVRHRLKLWWHETVSEMDKAFSAET